jgi:hypothetical protein
MLMTIPIIVVDPHFWNAAALFNSNAFPPRVRTCSATCGDRLAILTHSVEIVLNEPGLDRRRLLEEIRRHPSFAGFKPQPDKPALVIFHDLSFVSGLYSALIALKSLLDVYARLIARLLVPSASVFGFTSGVYRGRKISGGKFLNWIEGSSPSSFGDRDKLLSVFLVHIDDWLQKAVSYRNAVVHDGFIEGVTEVMLELDKEPEQLHESDLVLPLMPDHVAVTDYCERLVTRTQTLLTETLLLMPGIDSKLLALRNP